MVFFERLPFDSTLGFSRETSVCFENVPCKALYSEKRGFGTAPRQCDIHSKPQSLL